MVNSLQKKYGHVNYFNEGEGSGGREGEWGL